MKDMMRIRGVVQDAGRRLEVLEPGVETVEWAIVAALVAITAMGAVQALGGGVAHVYQNILSHISGMG
jgi:Flp pilus assembly pilin Flp